MSGTLKDAWTEQWHSPSCANSMWKGPEAKGREDGLMCYEDGSEAGIMDTLTVPSQAAVIFILCLRPP